MEQRQSCRKKMPDGGKHLAQCPTMVKKFIFSQMKRFPGF